MEQQLACLRAHLKLVKTMSSDQAEDQFYKLMVKAKDTLGQLSYPMASFYQQYAIFILKKIQKNMDLFNNQAVPQNVQEDDENDLDEIQQHFEEESSQQKQQSGANFENKNEPVQQEQNEKGNAAEPKDQPVIQEEDVNQTNKAQLGPEDEPDDKQICFCNLECAINIYNLEMQKINEGKQSPATINDLFDSLRTCRTALGDLFMIDEQYQRAVEEYRSVIFQQEKRQGHESNRAVAELHYLIGNSFLYENKEGCEKIALNEYIKSVGILVNHLGLILDYDISIFEIPTQQQYKVDRFAYLAKPNDNQAVKQLKEVISCLLDKIEDTYEQIGVRKAYDEQKKKIEEEKKKSEFKETSEETKVVHLGTFGNRKKVPDADISTSKVLQETLSDNSKSSTIPKTQSIKNHSQ